MYMYVYMYMYMDIGMAEDVILQGPMSNIYCESGMGEVHSYVSIVNNPEWHPCSIILLMSACIVYYPTSLCVQVLVDAVEDRAGGNHKVLARKIANSPLGEMSIRIIVYNLHVHVSFTKRIYTCFTCTYTIMYMYNALHVCSPNTIYSPNMFVG